jgi:hypothetical protein
MCLFDFLVFIYLFSLFVCDLFIIFWGGGVREWIVKKSCSSIIKEGSYPHIILLKWRCMFLINKTYVCMNLDLVVMEVENNLVVLSFIEVCHVGMSYLGNMWGVRRGGVFVWGLMDQVSKHATDFCRILTYHSLKEDGWCVTDFWSHFWHAHFLWL